MKLTVLIVQLSEKYWGRRSGNITSRSTRLAGSGNRGVCKKRYRNITREKVRCNLTIGSPPPGGGYSMTCNDIGTVCPRGGGGGGGDYQIISTSFTVSQDKDIFSLPTYYS